MKLRLIFLISIFFTINNGCSTKTYVPVAISDEEVYFVLKEPLIQTVLMEGRTVHFDEYGQEVYEYTFNDYITEIPYEVMLSRKVPYKDSTGYIGDWKTGMFTQPKYGDSTTSLGEFIVQMVKANNENNASHSDTMTWRTSGYIWNVMLTDEYFWLIEASTPSHKKWSIRTEIIE